MVRSTHALMCAYRTGTDEIGISIRVPVTNVSLVDLTVTLETPVSSKEELLTPFRRAATHAPSLFSGQARLQTPSVPHLGGVLGISDEQLVSSDFLGSTYSSVIDADACVMLNDRTVKVVAWYDNEYGFSTRSEFLQPRPQSAILWAFC